MGYWYEPCWSCKGPPQDSPMMAIRFQMPRNQFRQLWQRWLKIFNGWYLIRPVNWQITVDFPCHFSNIIVKFHNFFTLQRSLTERCLIDLPPSFVRATPNATLDTSGINISEAHSRSQPPRVRFRRGEEFRSWKMFRCGYFSSSVYMLDSPYMLHLMMTITVCRTRD